MVRRFEGQAAFSLLDVHLCPTALGRRCRPSCFPKLTGGSDSKACYFAIGEVDGHRQQSARYKKKADDPSPASRIRPIVLDGSHPFGAWPLWSPTFFVLHGLAFAKLVEARFLDIGRVEEHVLVRPRVDETKTLVRQSLNRTFSHQTHTFR